ncbi:hypothetical protein AB0H63_12250 [Micromonospora echinospora]|uniref:hypothetical protein n=1 Tax=Micromonospora echinospora TaxID=1877 RepID=UPI003402294D
MTVVQTGRSPSGSRGDGGDSRRRSPGARHGRPTSGQGRDLADPEGDGTSAAERAATA